jgi:hypothetical protein
MARTFPGRYSAKIEGDFVVFLIGMRINRPWKVHKWWPVLAAMRPMLRELEADPDSGLLHVQQALIGGGPAAVQYWRSFEHLERWSRDPNAAHLPAWREFNQRIRASGDVGIWHETYKVRAGEYETIYGNMPRVGLGAVGDLIPVGSTNDTAAVRIGERTDDRAPVAY